MTRLRNALFAVLAAAALVGTALTTPAYAEPPASGDFSTPTSPAAYAALAQGDVSLSWKLTTTGTTAQFRGLAPVSRRVAWVSGTLGTVLRTVDGGATWASVGPKLSTADAALQFRDIEAFSARDAVIMSIGNGTDSRIYVTSDGGTTWTETFRNTRQKAFYDCMAFSSRRHGYALSDPVDGKFRLIETKDGGHSWKVISNAGMVPALVGEAAFAASGTCLATGADNHVYIATGGVDPGRILSSGDGGHTWTATGSPIAGSAAAGVFSVQYRNASRGIAVGGDYTNTTRTGGDAAYTADGGSTWQKSVSEPAGYRSGSAWVAPWIGIALAVGPTGSDITLDNGKHWSAFDTGTFDAVECTPDLSCWASGATGRVARLVLR